MALDATNHRDIVVVGASAGGVEALRALVAGFPADLAAAVLVVLHMPAQAGSALPDILRRCGPLPATFARNGESLGRGRIHVAVPDHHLLVRDGRLVLSRTPKQNRARPAIDALFRSAARWHGPRSIGVILSGSLDDGAAGLAAIHASGGACIVEEPGDAIVNSMPRAALVVVPDAVPGPAHALGNEVAKLVARRIEPLADPAPDPELIVETDMAEGTARPRARSLAGQPVPVGCPDCGGGMRLLKTGDALYYRCHVGHVWSPQNLVAAQQEKVEQALWTAVSILEEQADIHEELARRASGNGAMLTRAHQLAAAAEIRNAAGVIHKHFPESLPNPLPAAAHQP